MKKRILKALFIISRNLRRLFVPRSTWTGNWSIGCGTCLNVPVRLDGIGMVSIGDKVSLGYPTGPRQGNGEILLQARTSNSRIVIGARTAFSNNVSVIACLGVYIGADCLIGDMVSVVDSDFHGLSPEDRKEQGKSAPVTIGDNVWLGARVMVLKGVTIGSGSLIGAGSVVTRDIPPRCLAAGSPARVIRKL